MGKRKESDVPEDYYDAQDSDNVCFLCNKPRYSERQTIKHFGFPVVFMQCECGIIKQTPMPNEKFFSWFFNSDIFFKSKEKTEHIWGFYDYFKDEPSRLATSKRRYKKLKKLLGLTGRLSIMKIGPSTGTFLHVAQKDGHNVLGCDISDEFSRYAKDNYGVDIEIGRFEKMNYEENRFDVVVLLNVIENIPNLEEFMNSVYKSIKPGGYFVFNHVPMDSNLIEKVQKGKYFMYRPPICYMFTKKALNKFMSDFGFVLHKNMLDIRFMTLEKIFSLLGWRKVLRVFEFLKLARFNIPVWGYPSILSIYRVDKVED